MDIYNIPIHKITSDYLDFIHKMEDLNMEQASEFILFASTLIGIKARMLLPRRELDDEGNEIDPRAELVDKLIEYKRFKEASVLLAALEEKRMQFEKRGNAAEELSKIGKEAAEGSEIESVTLFKLMKAFERVMKRLEERQSKPQHVVVKYNYSLDTQRVYLLDNLKRNKKQTFEDLFLTCENRIHAIFNLLALLDLVQQHYLSILLGEGRNNFVVKWNDNREEETEISGS